MGKYSIENPRNEIQTREWLAAHLCEFPFDLAESQAAFPDYILKMQNGEIITAEIEYKSANFNLHGHNIDGCDLVICWIHNGEIGLPVLELSTKKIHGYFDVYTDIEGNSKEDLNRELDFNNKNEWRAIAEGKEAARKFFKQKKLNEFYNKFDSSPKRYAKMFGQYIVLYCQYIEAYRNYKEARLKVWLKLADIYKKFYVDNLPLAKAVLTTSGMMSIILDYYKKYIKSLAIKKLKHQ